MSCVIQNAMKLHINQAQTDISEEKVLPYIDGIVNIKKGGARGAGGNIFPSFMRCIIMSVSSYPHSVPWYVKCWDPYVHQFTLTCLTFALMYITVKQI